MIGQHVKTPAHLWPMFENMIDLCPLGSSITPEWWDARLTTSGWLKKLYWNGDYSRLKDWIPYLIKWHKNGFPVYLLAPMGDNEEMRQLFDYGIFFLIPSSRLFESIQSVNVIILTGGKSR